eukprot:scaffold1883_cov261-Pinguiococcus_pyrenoidosus.AAC.40
MVAADMKTPDSTAPRKLKAKRSWAGYFVRLSVAIGALASCSTICSADQSEGISGRISVLSGAVDAPASSSWASLRFRLLRSGDGLALAMGGEDRRAAVLEDFISSPAVKPQARKGMAKKIRKKVWLRSRSSSSGGESVEPLSSSAGRSDGMSSVKTSIICSSESIANASPAQNR